MKAVGMYAVSYLMVLITKCFLGCVKFENIVQVLCALQSGSSDATFIVIRMCLFAGPLVFTHLLLTSQSYTQVVMEGLVNILKLVNYNYTTV